MCIRIKYTNRVVIRSKGMREIPLDASTRVSRVRFAPLVFAYHSLNTIMIIEYQTIITIAIAYTARVSALQ